MKTLKRPGFTRAFASVYHVVMSSLILNETTLFYLNLRATAPNTGTSSSFNKVKDWTSHVAKANKPNSVRAPSIKSSSLIPSKRTTSSSSAIVITRTLAQPQTKKIKLDNRNLTTYRYEEEPEEDEEVEREAALKSPTKGNKRINNKVCHISHHASDRRLTCQ
jgi:hypothetical protein